MHVEYDDRDLDQSGCGPTGFCPANGEEVLEFCKFKPRIRRLSTKQASIKASRHYARGGLSRARWALTAPHSFPTPFTDDLKDLSFGANLGMLVALAVFFRTIAFLILRSKGPVFDKTI